MRLTQRPDRGTVSNQRAVAVADTGSDERLLLTAAEHRAYEQELAHLLERRDRELPDRLRDARTYVAADAVEEIAQIQEEQSVTDARIARLEALLHNAWVIPDDQGGDVVSIGCTVEVEYRASGRRTVYRLTGAGNGGDRRWVSARSPIGQALMGGRVGDVVSAELPNGRVEELLIVSIAPAGEPVA